MFKKLLSVLLVGLLLQFACVEPASAATNAEKEAHHAEKVRTGIASLGIGPQALVEVKLRDKTKLKGYIREATDDYFVVVDATGNPTRVAYPQVKGVKGNNLSTGAQIAIGLGIIAAIILVTIIFVKQTK